MFSDAHIGRRKNQMVVTIDGKPLYKCDVCWTCGWFDHGEIRCKFMFYTPGQFKDSRLNPESYKCSYWEEGKQTLGNGKDIEKSD
jgi:hypothetical protein